MLETWNSLVPLLIVVTFVVFLCCDWLRHRCKVQGGAINKWVLITGCDSGFGKQTAKQLDSIGCRVFAGCLTADGCFDLSKTCSSRLVPVYLDVTSEESVQKAFDTVCSLLPPEQGLWAVVNNAGVMGALGPVDWLAQEDFVNVFQVNVLGMVRVVRTFLPLLKRSKCGGRVVNMSSIFGKLSIPYASPYCMAKHAVEAFSDSLRVELHPYKIRVSIIEPGGHRTEFMEGISSNTLKSWDRLPELVKQSYGEGYLRQVMFLGTKLIPLISSSSLDGVVGAYQHALFSRNPQRRYLVGLDALVLSLTSFIPSFLLDFALNLPGLRAAPSACRNTFH